MNREVLAIVLSLCSLVALPLRAEDAPKPAEAQPVEQKTEEKKTEEKKKPASTRIFPRGPEIEKLKAELGLSDAQIDQARIAVASVTKKNEELHARTEVAAAEEEVKKAKEALKAAEEKAKAARENFELNDEYKKAVLSIVPDDKKEKAFDLLNLEKPKAPKAKKEEKKDEAKAVPAVAPPAPHVDQK